MLEKKGIGAENIQVIYDKIQKSLLNVKSPVEDTDDDDECKRVLSKIESWYSACPNLSQRSYNPIEIIFPREYKNNFADWLIWRAFWSEQRYASSLDPCFGSFGGQGAYTLVQCSSLDLSGAVEFIDGCLKHRAKWETINPKYHFLYYVLLVLAIDDDAFYEKMNQVAEFIYLLEISEKILDDFLRVVQEVLSDKERASSDFQTSEARNFFERR